MANVCIFVPEMWICVSNSKPSLQYAWGSSIAGFVEHEFAARTQQFWIADAIPYVAAARYCNLKDRVSGRHIRSTIFHFQFFTADSCSATQKTSDTILLVFLSTQSKILRKMYMHSRTIKWSHAGGLILPIVELAFMNVEILHTLTRYACGGSWCRIVDIS